MIKASEIVDEAIFEKWLKEQPDGISSAVAIRVSLRVLPIALSINQRITTTSPSEIELEVTLRAFQVSFLTWMKQKYRIPNQIIITYNNLDIIINAAKRADSAADVARNYPPAAAALAAAGLAGYSHIFYQDKIHVVETVGATTRSVSFYTSGSNILTSIRADVEWLENNQGDINALIDQPLWLESSIDPEVHFNLQEFINDEFEAFRQTDLAQDTSFGLIADWYAALLPEHGKPRSLFGEKKDIELAKQPEEFWDGDAQEVMDRVAKLVGWPVDYRNEDNQYEDGWNEGEALSLEEVTPEIPPMKPAAIMPEWRDGKLSLPLEPIENDFSAGDIDQALSALKKELLDFSDDLRKSNNIDPRIVEYISDVAEEAPETVPTQEEFFRFAHKEEVLRGLVDQASQEWDSMLAAKFRGLTRLFSQTVQQFPLWREFIKVEYNEIQTPEDLETIKELEVKFAENLQDELVEFVDPQVPEALSSLTNEIPDVYPVIADESVISESVQRQANDVLESMNNILKALFKTLVALKDGSAKVGSVTAEVVKKAAGNVKDQSPISGEKMVRDITDQVIMSPANALRAVLKTVKWTTIGTGLGGSFYATFNWLPSILNFLGLK